MLRSMNPSLRVSSRGLDFETFSYRLLAEQLVALVLVFSLVLLSLGPTLDHHFAERHPGHHHLYLGSTDSYHSHDFQSVHAHPDSWMYEQTDAAETAGTGEIVFLVPVSGAGIGSAEFAVPVVVQSLRFSNSENDAMLGLIDKSGAVLIGTSISPPTRPPRV